MVKDNFQCGGWNSYTLQCCMIMTMISPGDCTLQCDMWLWNRDSEFTKWQHRAMWYVALGWYATMPLNSPAGSTLQYDTQLWNHDIEFAGWQHPAMWQVALEWHATEFAQTSAILEFYIWFHCRPNHSPQSTSFCTSLLNFIQIGPLLAEKNDVMTIFKMADLSHLAFKDPIMGSLKNPITTS